MRTDSQYGKCPHMPNWVGFGVTKPTYIELCNTGHAGVRYATVGTELPVLVLLLGMPMSWPCWRPWHEPQTSTPHANACRTGTWHTLRLPVPLQSARLGTPLKLMLRCRRHSVSDALARAPGVHAARPRVPPIHPIRRAAPRRAVGTAVSLITQRPHHRAADPPSRVLRLS
jgi:hypothetical protein